MNLHAQRLDVIRAISAAREVREVELNLIPAFVETHGHRTNERLHACRALIIRRAKSSTYVLVIEDLDFEGKVLSQVLDDHHEKRELNPEGLARLNGARDVIRADICAHDF